MNRLLQAGGLQTPTALVAVYKCLEQKSWDHLRALSEGGFDLAANHSQGRGDAEVTETLLHRCVRIHQYDELADRLQHLLELGTDPHVFSGQGLSVLALLAVMSRDLPPHRTQEAFAVLQDAGVRMTDPCSNGQGLSGKMSLIDHDQAHKLFASRCQELGPWARALWEQEQLEEQTRPSMASRQLPRL